MIVDEFQGYVHEAKGSGATHLRVPVSKIEELLAVIAILNTFTEAGK